MNKIKLDPKSALFLEWGSKFYQSKDLGKYLNHLDLSAADEIKSEFNSICNFFDEAFINKEFLIENFIQKKLYETEKEHLLIVLAAGKSPLSLDLVQKYSEKINKVIEIDISGMDEKKEIYYVHYPECADKIKCITADFTSTPILEFMNNLLNEYYKDLPCIILLEGVSYLLSKDQIEKIVSSFKSKNQNNTFILEYLLPEEEISPDRKSIPQKSASGLLEKKAGLISGNALTNMMSKLDAKLVKKENLANAEKLRTGKNKFFPKPEDSWMECSVWQI